MKEVDYMARQRHTPGAFGKITDPDDRAAVLDNTNKARRGQLEQKRQLEAEQLGFRREQAAKARDFQSYTRLHSDGTVRQIADMILERFPTTPPDRRNQLSRTETAFAAAVRRLRVDPSTAEAIRAKQVASHALRWAYDQVTRARAQAALDRMTEEDDGEREDWHLFGR